MTDEEWNQVYEGMVVRWGDRLPSIDHEPIRFKYYVNLYLYYKKRDML